MISGVKKERGRTAGASSQFVPHISFRIMLEGGGGCKQKENKYTEYHVFVSRRATRVCDTWLHAVFVSLRNRTPQSISTLLLDPYCSYYGVLLLP